MTHNVTACLETTDQLTFLVFIELQFLLCIPNIFHDKQNGRLWFSVYDTLAEQKAVHNSDTGVKHPETCQ